MKKVWLVILIIIIIALIAGCAYKIVNTNSESKKSENIINETSANMSTTVNSANTENETNNASNVNENKENEVKNETIENKVENEVNNNVEQNNTVQNTQATSTEVLTESPKTNEEKAIKIVKEDWNSEEGVYFSSMGIDSQGRYIVTVNDSNTTGTLAWYAVNVVTGEFEIQ